MPKGGKTARQIDEKMVCSGVWKSESAYLSRLCLLKSGSRVIGFPKIGLASIHPRSDFFGPYSTPVIVVNYQVS
jgi:hypothetical protein